MGQAYQQLGQKQQAQNAYAESRAIIDSLAATIDDADLRDGFLRAAYATLPTEKPLTARRAEAERYGGLTERERVVAGLIAQGKSNQEIADTLVVSKRTVETHVGNVMAKLGATTRAQVVAWAIEQGLAQTPR